MATTAKATATLRMTVITITPAITMMGRGCISGESTATTVTGKTEEPGFGRALSFGQRSSALSISRPALRHASPPRSMCDWDVHPLTPFRSRRTNRNRANQRDRSLKQELMPIPSNHPHDDDRGAQSRVRQINLFAVLLRFGFAH